MDNGSWWATVHRIAIGHNWSAHHFQNFPQFVVETIFVIYTIKGFSTVNEADIFLEFLCFLYVPVNVGIWFLVPHPFLNPACIFGSSQFTYSWILSWRILSIILLAYEMNPVMVVWTLFGIGITRTGMKTDRGELSHYYTSVQFSSVAQSWLTLCHPMNRSMPGLPVHHHLPEFTQIHVHQVSDAIQPSHPLSSPSPPAPNPSQHQSLIQWVNSLHEVAKVLEFQL